MDYDLEELIDSWADRMGVGATTGLADKIYDAGYRLDPYPNGKSKGELIARIEELEGERDKMRNVLFDIEGMAGLPIDIGVFINKYLTKTSTVKP